MSSRIEAWPNTYVDARQTSARPEEHAELSRWVCEAGNRYTLPPGTIAFRQGGRSLNALLLLSGHAVLRRAEPNGLEVTVGMCGPGTLLGLPSVLRGEPHIVAACIRVESEVVAVAAERLTEAMTVPSLRAALVCQLAAEHLALVRRYTARAALSVRDRVQILLDEEASRLDRLPGPVPLGPADLAAIIGADPSHLYRVLRELRAAGTIDFSRGRITVRERLRRPGADG